MSTKQVAFQAVPNNDQLNQIQSGLRAEVLGALGPRALEYGVPPYGAHITAFGTTDLTEEQIEFLDNQPFEGTITLGDFWAEQRASGEMVMWGVHVTTDDQYRNSVRRIKTEFEAEFPGTELEVKAGGSWPIEAGDNTAPINLGYSKFTAPYNWGHPTVDQIAAGDSQSAAVPKAAEWKPDHLEMEAAQLNLEAARLLTRTDLVVSDETIQVVRDAGVDEPEVGEILGRYVDSAHRDDRTLTEEDSKFLLTHFSNKVGELLVAALEPEIASLNSEHSGTQMAIAGGHPNRHEVSSFGAPPAMVDGLSGDAPGGNPYLWGDQGLTLNGRQTVVRMRPW